MTLRPRAQELLTALLSFKEPVTRKQLTEKCDFSNDNVTPELGATDKRVREQYEGKPGKDGYTADDDGHSLLGLGLVGTAKLHTESRTLDVFWITEKGRQALES